MSEIMEDSEESLDELRRKALESMKTFQNNKLSYEKQVSGPSSSIQQPKVVMSNPNTRSNLRCKRRPLKCLNSTRGNLIVIPLKVRDESKESKEVHSEAIGPSRFFRCMSSEGDSDLDYEDDDVNDIESIEQKWLSPNNHFSTDSVGSKSPESFKDVNISYQSEDSSVNESSDIDKNECNVANFDVESEKPILDASNSELKVNETLKYNNDMVQNENIDSDMVELKFGGNCDLTTLNTMTEQNIKQNLDMKYSSAVLEKVKDNELCNSNIKEIIDVNNMPEMNLKEYNDANLILDCNVEFSYDESLISKEIHYSAQCNDTVSYTNDSAISSEDSDEENESILDIPKDKHVSTKCGTSFNKTERSPSTSKKRPHEPSLKINQSEYQELNSMPSEKKSRTVVLDVPKSCNKDTELFKKLKSHVCQVLVPKVSDSKKSLSNYKTNKFDCSSSPDRFASKPLPLHDLRYSLNRKKLKKTKHQLNDSDDLLVPSVHQVKSQNSYKKNEKTETGVSRIKTIPSVIMNVPSHSQSKITSKSYKEKGPTFSGRSPSVPSVVKSCNLQERGTLRKAQHTSNIKEKRMKRFQRTVSEKKDYIH